MTDPTPSFTTSSRLISVSPKRIATGSSTSSKTPRVLFSSALFTDLSTRRLHFSIDVAGDAEGPSRGIDVHFSLQFVFACDFDVDGPVFPLVQNDGVIHLQ